MIWLSFKKPVGALEVFGCARAKRFNLRGIIRFIAAAAIACVEGHYAHAPELSRPEATAPPNSLANSLEVAIPIRHEPAKLPPHLRASHERPYPLFL